MRGPVWDDAKLTIAFPILLGTEVYAVVAITSAPPLFRFELIETMAARVAEQLARVAERERAQAEVARARDEAMEASRQKSDFLATMSHEIRTPLNGVIGLNDLLLRTSLTPEQHRLSAGVEAAGRTLLGLINDILDFSKIEAGRLELERLDFDVRLLLEQVSAMLTELAREKRLDLVVSCHPDVPAVLSGDPTRLAQVITNLVANAVKFTEHGVVAVRATAEPDDDRVRLRVEVTDTGVGVPRSQQTHLFEPFTQGDSSTTRIYGGTGLGLAISSELVDAMGGTLEYTANPGGGSVFTCTVALDRGTGSAAINSDDVRARELLHGRRALVVADEPHGSVLAEQLAWWGVRSDHVATAADGHPLLDDGAYDVVLVDGPDPGTLGEVAPVVELAAPHLAGDLRVALLRLLAGEDTDGVVQRSGEQSGKGWILVVEDNAVNQLVATGLLAALGYTTETADDGLAAIEAARDGGFDAILMDVQMPHMDGYTATRHIRAHETGRRQPIIAMTAAAVAGERERCLEAGMDDFLTKPVDAVRLAETLKRWLAPQPVVRRPAGPGPAGGAAGARRPRRRVVVRRPGDRELPRQRRRAARPDGGCGGLRRRRPAAGGVAPAGRVGAQPGCGRAGRGGPGARGAHHERLDGRRRGGAAGARRASGCRRRGAPRLPARAVPGPGLLAFVVPLVPLVVLVEQPLAAGRGHQVADLRDRSAAVVDLPVALGRELLAQLGPQPVADLLPGGVEDGQLLLGEVVVDHAGQLLDGVVEGLGVGALELEHGQHRVVPLGVLLLAVLGLVLGDRVPAAEPGVDVLLLGDGVRGVQRGQRAAYGVPVGRAVTQVAQEGLEAPVVVEDQLDHVALGRPAQVDSGVCHGAEVPIYALQR